MRGKEGGGKLGDAQHMAVIHGDFAEMWPA